MATMSWKRSEPGHYTCGPYEITGTGNEWTLQLDGTQLGHYSSKREAQEAAQRDRDGEPSDGARQMGDKDLLESLRLDIAQLNYRCAELTFAIKKLCDLLGVEVPTESKEE